MWTSTLTGIGYTDEFGECGVGWEQAMQEARAERFGYSDWRLPNIRELLGISGIMTSSKDLYWTSTPDYYDPNKKWSVHFRFNVGTTVTTLGYNWYECYVRLVRDNIYPSNQPPNQPINISPENGAAGIPLTLTLQSSPFSDLDIGDTHTASQWQVTTISGHYSPPASYIFDSGVDTQNLTQIAIDGLSYGTTYYWHVRHQDNNNTWSEWSPETSFTTLQTVDLAVGPEDISFHSITLDNAVLSKANEIAIAGEIHNEYSVPATNIQVKFTDETSGDLIGTAQLQKLEPHSSAYLDVKWELSSDIENHTVRVEIEGMDQIDHSPDNNKASKVVSVYYADEAPFDLRVGAYSFENPDLTDFLGKPKVDDEYAMTTDAVFTPTAKAIAASHSDRGYCAGMAATGILYKECPELKPGGKDKKVWDMSMYDQQVTDKIKLYQMEYARIWGCWWCDLEAKYEQIKNSLVGDPDYLVMLMMKTEGKKWGIWGITHAVVPYKIIDLGNEKRVYIYDPNYHMDADCKRAIACAYVTFDLSNETFIKPQYEMFFADFEVFESDIDNNYRYVIKVISPMPEGPDEEAMKDSRQAAFDYFNESLKTENFASIMFASPIEANLIDQYGRKMGYFQGAFINEIPGAAFEQLSNLQVYYVPANLTYTIETFGIDVGIMDLYYMIPKGDIVFQVTYEDVPTDVGAKTTIDMGQQVTDYAMQMDNDGDGHADGVKHPDYIDYIADIQVTIDIKPDSYPNSINLGSRGVTPVAILSSPDFDATQVDPSMVELSGAGVAVKGKAKTLAHQEDVNGDGLIDLVIQVETENLNPAELQTGKAYLIGCTYAGNSIAGSDEIVIVPTEDAPAKPTEFALYQNFSNPLNPDTWIPYQLAEDANVVISIYDVSGHLIKTLTLGHKPTGFYTTKEKAAYWDGKNEAGEHVASGIYFYTIQAKEYTATRKMLMLK